MGKIDGFHRPGDVCLRFDKGRKVAVGAERVIGESW
jgi:hypothetical protein